MKNLNTGWNFDNSFARLPQHFFSQTLPDKAPNPKVIIINDSLARELGLNLCNIETTQLATLFSGTELPSGVQPISQAYAGHQFGYFTYLGDGRAHLIGEHITPGGKRFDIQFKGSGQTPYGLRGDGKATLGPMLREYLISEAMHALGIPTTRSLAVVTTGEPVLRETFLPGAVLTRVASSHLRVGTFEYFSARKDTKSLKILADYTISRHFPEAIVDENPYLQLLKIVIKKQIALIVHWMRVGFIHGVMNTDNVALSGETIDYGPCAFIDHYDPATVFSSIDQLGRYSYGNQPGIAQWNLARFAETLLPLLDKDESKAIELARQSINEFIVLYKEQWLNMMRAKLGLFGEQTQDMQLITDLLHWMHQHKADYTNTFRSLSKGEILIHSLDLQPWYKRWQDRLLCNNKPWEESVILMNAHNPVVIPRNHKVEYALNEALNHHMPPFHELLSVLKDPYKELKTSKAYQTPPNPDECIHQTFCGT